MRTWFPLAILLSVAWLLLVSVLISHGGDDGDGTFTPLAGDAAALLRQSQAAMLDLDSLEAEMTSPWEGRELTYRVAWQRPDSFHILYPNLTVEYETGKDPVTTDHGLVEAIAIGERMYSRQCAEENEDCQPWEENARNGAYMPGFTGELDPFWTFELLVLMSDAHVVGQEDVDGVACAHIEGRANIMQAMVQSWRRAEEIRGPLDWGEECTAAATEPGGETQEECHKTTLDEYIVMLEESAASENMSGPGPVEVWVGEDDRRVRRLDLLQYAPVEVVAMSFTYSRFNEVTVEPPK